MEHTYITKSVSVPIWGLFNLTGNGYSMMFRTKKENVSVPIWGLFNLTIIDPYSYYHNG